MRYDGQIVLMPNYVKVFLSWSGEVSRALALELRTWLPMVVQQIKPWISGKDIDPGQRWALALSQGLDNVDFGIICLTRENKEAPWILFEAGAIAGSREGKVIPLLYGLKPNDLDGPLAQFQSLLLDQKGIRSLVNTLSSACDSSLEQHQQETLFKALWPLLEEYLKLLSSTEAPSKSIQSRTDLLASLEQEDLLSIDSSPEGTKNLFDLLDLENKQLAYLTKQERLLRKQGIPISLVEAAIKPTRFRLNQVEKTLDKTLDSTFSNLDTSQVEYILQLASQAPIGNENFNSPVVTPPTDISALMNLGLIQSNPQGAMSMHPAVADYVTRQFGPT